MLLMRFDSIELSFGGAPLLNKVNGQLSKGDKICLIGRNGAGKSSLMKIIAGLIRPDSGKIWKTPHIQVAKLEQSLPLADDKTVYQVVASGVSHIESLVQKWHNCSQNIDSDSDLKQLDALQQQIELNDGWNLKSRINQVLDHLQLSGNQPMSSLSGGWRRKVKLAQTLVSQPDILLLDEPTNHLDILAIKWLENMLLSFQGALLFVSHDRSFLQAVASNLWELDRGELTEWNCSYEQWLDKKAHKLAVEASHQSEFDKKLAKEEAWIRQGIKARRTRNEGRVRALEALRETRKQRINVQGTAQMKLSDAERSGKLVIQAEHVKIAFDDRVIVQDFNFTLLRGDKVGLIGANGVGKTSLLKTLLGKQKPTSGTVKLGSKLEVAYFDQLREKLNHEHTILDNVAQGRERILINNKEVHIISYLEKFLFSPERARTKISALSGGEINRLLLAKLFSNPANLLILDEPTNDLDVETLELLENLLVSYQGTLILVSHDRKFLDNVVTSTLVFEAPSVINEYVAGFEDWIRQGGSLEKLDFLNTKTTEQIDPKNQPEANSPKTKPATDKTHSKKKKLSYKLQRELEALPNEIERLENDLEALQATTSTGDFFQQDRIIIETELKKLSELEQLIEDKLQRWSELQELE